jgi:uncharacterized membrane protein YuzA (DUF378 family)
MKKFLIVLTLLFSQLAVGQTVASVIDSTKSVVSNAIDSTKTAVKKGIGIVDTSSNFKMVYTDIKDGITALALGLRVGAEHVYMVLVKQQIVYAIVYLIIGLFALFLIVNWINGYKDTKQKWHDDDITGLGIIKTIQIAIAGVMLGVFLFHIDNIVMGFVNPEYGAIQEIIDIVKDNKLK